MKRDKLFLMRASPKWLEKKMDGVLKSKIRGKFFLQMKKERIRVQVKITSLNK